MLTVISKANHLISDIAKEYVMSFYPNEEVLKVFTCILKVV